MFFLILNPLFHNFSFFKEEILFCVSLRKILLRVFSLTLYSLGNHICQQTLNFIIENIWHGKWSTIFGRFWMKGIPESKIYFHYSKLISEKIHDD